jgi:hypothetical protein
VHALLARHIDTTHDVPLFVADRDEDHRFVLVVLGPHRVVAREEQRLAGLARLGLRLLPLLLLGQQAIPQVVAS